MNATPLSATSSPVAVGFLSDFLGDVQGQDVLLSSLLVTATDEAIRYMGRDLLEREWELVHWTWPIDGTMSAPSLSRQNFNLRQTVELPYATEATGLSVEIEGEATEDFILQRDRLYFRFTPAILEPSDSPALKVTYTAGYGPDSDSIPQPIKTAITMLAAFLFEHRGECDVMEGMKRSGAAMLLAPYRKASALA